MSDTPAPWPLTRAERTDYTETSTHADVLRFIAELDGLGSASLRITDFGATPEGRLLPLLILSQRGLFTPEQALASRLPIALILCGIHALSARGVRGPLRRDSHPRTLSPDGLLACGLIDPPVAGAEFPAWRVHGVETRR